MPKIHRIRIVGLRYDGMQKQYEDTTFDFHNEETSTNGLIAMMNGGGVRSPLEAGEVTFGDLFAIQPFGNVLN